MFFLFILIVSIKTTPIKQATWLYDYYMANHIIHTKSLNAVTSIYLNYRVFDTLFETLLLLVSIIGIIYFSRHEGDY